MNNPIEGVDYIVDHYAVLGLDPQADADAVHKAIREMRARNHPDRLGRTSDEILRTAQRQTDLANRAAAVLEDLQRRPPHRPHNETGPPGPVHGFSWVKDGPPGA